MVAEGQSNHKKECPKSLIVRLNKECSQKGLFVGASGSVSVKDG